MSSLETSITLDDVFTVALAKRVPLAPELAGYLTLEIADGADAGDGDVDPKTVFISEEGTVALVRPKRDSVVGDAEASVRSLLMKLLEASGSGTPSLTTAATRRPGNGLPALVEELEAALIPVNRSAGRRALARLVREVKRVLLGLGRNASPLQNRAEGKAPSTAPHARPLVRKRESDPKFNPPKEAKGSESAPAAKLEVRRLNQFDEEPATAKKANELTDLASNMNRSERGPGSPDGAHEGPRGVGKGRPAFDPVESRSRLDEGPNAARAALHLPRSTAGSIPAPPVAGLAGLPGPPPQPRREPLPAPSIAEAKPPSIDEVDSLLGSFGVSNAHGDKQLARELKAIAGLSPTPPPPDAKTLAELTRDVGKDLPRRIDSGQETDGVEALLALADASVPLPGRAANAAPPAAVPSPAANLPPSPIFGAGPNAAATGAPASLRHDAPARHAEPPRQRPAPAAAPPRAKPGNDVPATTAGPSKVGRAANGPTPPRAPKTGMAMLVLALLVLAGATVAVWKFAPQVFTGRKPVVSARPSATASAPPAPKCKVALVLSDVPSSAEILLRVGQAPVDVERMPVNTRLEFVATAEGYAPRRAIIKGESPWDKGADGKPRIEVPIQLDPSKAKPGSLDPWPPAEPGSQVGGSGAPGTVHVVSNVRGAEVWLLAGLGPEARIDQLRCDAEIDVLFAGPPTLRRRLHIDDKEIAATATDAAGNKVVTISAKDGTK